MLAKCTACAQTGRIGGKGGLSSGRRAVGETREIDEAMRGRAGGEWRKGRKN